MSEKPKHHPERKLPVGRVLIGAIVLIVLWLGFGIKLHFEHTPLALEMARNKWEASNIRDYEMTLILYNPPVFAAEIFMHVEDNQIVRMEQGSSFMLSSDHAPVIVPIDLSQEPSWYTGMYGASSFLAPSLQDYEVGRLFEFTESLLPDAPLVSLCNSQLHYELKFNQEYGFVEEITSVSCGEAWLCATISHCQAGFRVDEFVPHSK